MSTEIERRLDFFIIFRSYCEYKFKNNGERNRLSTGRETIALTEDFDFFYYSRWKTKEEIKSALVRLNYRKNLTGISFSVTEQNVGITIEADRFDSFVSSYLKKIKQSTSLAHAAEEDRRECNKVLKFSDQKDRMMRLILDYYCRFGDSTLEMGRFDLGEIEPKPEQYQRFCFEEVMLIFSNEELVAIKDVYTKERQDSDTQNLVWMPVITIEYLKAIKCGRLVYDQYTDSVLLDDKVIVKRSDKKPVLNTLVLRFLKSLITANGEFVKTKTLEKEMTVGLSKGMSYGAKGVSGRIKKRYPEIAVFIKAAGTRKNSEGYKIVR